jgi:hypothetical protein
MVTAVTAVVLGYITTRQDAVFDVLDDASGTQPLLVHPFKSELTFFNNPWALPAPPPVNQITPAMDQQDLENLLISSKAVPIGSSELGVTLEGNINDSVIVEEISARIVSRSPVPHGAFISPPIVGGGEPKIILGFNLDAADRRARIRQSDGSLGEFFGKSEYLEIHRGEKLVFTFLGIAKSPVMYRWVVDLSLQFGGTHHTLTLGETSPYAITGPVNEYGLYYQRVSRDQIEPTVAERACPGGCTAWADHWTRANG